MFKCIKELKTKSFTFKEGETYNGAKVNEHWHCIEAVGVKVEDFNEHFTDEKENERVVTEE